MSTRFQDPAGRWSSMARVSAVIFVRHPTIHFAPPSSTYPLGKTDSREGTIGKPWVDVGREMCGQDGLSSALSRPSPGPQLRTRPGPQPHQRSTFLAHPERGRKRRRIRAGKGNTRPTEPLRISDR